MEKVVVIEKEETQTTVSIGLLAAAATTFLVSTLVNALGSALGAIIHGEPGPTFIISGDDKVE